VLITRAYHHSRGDDKRIKILIPDSAHGTNPATSAMSGMQVVQLPSDERGNVNLQALRAECDDSLAGIMITNPNTLGLFEENIEQVCEIVHQAGGLVYGDGANMNALLGIARPGELGIDAMHYNLHKTFSTPHGGGGPGSGPVGVVEKLVDFLPAPVVIMVEEGDEEMPPLYGFTYPEKSIGRVKSFYGQFGMMLRAYTYIRMHGPDGLRKVSEYAVLNANYLLTLVKDAYHLPYERVCMHEFVVEGRWADVPDIHALDIAKRLMDYNFHPPTNYFPLIVHEALMIEPTETESKQTLDEFAQALLQIAEEARSQPELLKGAPHNTPVGRLDEVKAAKELVLCCAVDFAGQD
jgi:glycine dehydrogenase subunit 2